MTLSERIAELVALDVDERIELVQAIWDSIATDRAYPGLTEAQQQEIARRLADHEANPDDVVPWEQVESETLSRIRR